MIVKNLDSLHLEKMTDSNNRDKYFRLIWIQNLSIGNIPYFFGLFKDIAPKGKYLLAMIAPEILSLYALGAIFYNGIRQYNSKQEVGEIIDLNFISCERNIIKKADEVFNDDLYDLQHANPKYSKQQYCVVVETDSQIIIIPCFLIAAVYYFRSASLRIQLVAHNIQGLYEINSLKLDRNNREAVIKLNSNANDNDAADIVRFVTNKNAHKHWEEVVNNIRAERYVYENLATVPIKADFPTAEAFKITARVKKLRDGVSGKEKILVLEILEENSSFEFDKLTIFRDDREPFSFDWKKRAKAIRTSNTITNRIPTEELTPAIIENTDTAKNPNKEEMTVVKTHIASNKIDRPTPLVIEGIGHADLSFESSESDGDCDVRHGTVRSAVSGERNVVDRNCFSLTDFMEMIGALANENLDVQNFQTHSTRLMPNNSYNKKSLREYSDRQHSRKRRFLYVTLLYRNRNVCVVEIDQNGLPGGSSTYVLISESNYDFTANDVDDVLRVFVNAGKIEAIEKEVGKKGLRFLTKKHPSGKDEEDYRNWRQRLLARVSG